MTNNYTHNKERGGGLTQPGTYVVVGTPTEEVVITDDRMISNDRRRCKGRRNHQLFKYMYVN